MNFLEGGVANAISPWDFREEGRMVKTKKKTHRPKGKKLPKLNRHRDLSSKLSFVNNHNT